ncbi:unnamed protein product [Alopecurus aequalis]
MSSPMDEMNLPRQTQRQHQHHMAVRAIGEEIDLEIDQCEDPSFSDAALVGVNSPQDPVVPADDHKSFLIPSSQPAAVDGQPQPTPPQREEHEGTLRLPAHTKKKKKVVKKWREEWADTYKWAYVAVHDNTSRIFCTVCKEYGRKHRRNPYGNEGSRNMQMSALEEHNNSLLHKEALRLQSASKEKVQSPQIERPVYVKALSKTAASILESVLKKDPHEAEFIQSIQEVVHSIEPVLVKNSQYVQILERLLEPERCFIFRVPWVDDKGEAHVNRGFRVQFSQALGPCRGGLRFHPSMNLSVAKFLAFEQTLKNALSLYKLGGAGGGSDFDPKGKSESEVMRFCQSFMDELYRYLGPDQDLPSEDVGVGPREMGYLFGQYRRLSGHFQGNFTGPKIFWSGSSFRTEATGYGLVFCARVVLADMNKELKGLRFLTDIYLVLCCILSIRQHHNKHNLCRCAISGCGKIAMHVLEKLLSCEAIPVTVSDSKGYLLDGDGFDYVKYSLIRNIKAQQKSLKEYLKTFPRAKYVNDAKPWGSNMPCTAQAVDILRKAKVHVAPAKATAAGGVAVGELELNSEFSLMQWSVEDFENKIQDAVKQTYDRSMKAAQDYGIMKENPESLVHGANISAFLNIAQAMTDQGCV